MLRRNLCYDLKKNICSVNFLLACTAVFMLILITNCVVYDGSTPNYSFPGFVLNTDRSFWQSSILYSRFNMFLRGFSSQWLAYFLPILTGISCVPMLCDEINSNNFRMVCVRGNIRSYITSKFICAFITASLTVIIPYIIFGIFCYFTFPPTESYREMLTEIHAPRGIAGQEQLNALFSNKSWPLNALFDTNSGWVFLTGKLLLTSAYAALPCLLTMVMAALTLNKFVSMAFPVMICFGVSQVLINAISKASENSESIGFWQFFEFQGRFYRFESEFEETVHLPTSFIFAYIVLALILLYFVFEAILNRKLRV